MSNAFSSTIEYTATPVEAKEFIEKVESLEEKATRIAEEYGIDKQAFFNLIECESRWDPKADNGSDRGLLQINRKHWPDITDDQAFDPEFSMRFAAEKIKNGEGFKWVCGNCYAYANLLSKFNLPRMIEIVPNSLTPRVGDIAVLRYRNNKHIGVISKVTTEGVLIKECNFEPNKCGTRLIEWADPHLKGYFTLADG